MKLSAGSRAFLVLVLLVVLVGAVSFLLSWMMPALVSRVSADAIRVITSPYFYLGRLPVTPAFLFKSLLFLLLIGLLARTTREFLKQRVLPHTSMDIGQQYALARFTGYFVFVIGLLIGLQSAGLNLSSLALIGGALGIGIGFGLQPIVANFVAGLILLAERPVKVGDRIEIGGPLGNVIRIRGRATWVRTNDNFIIVVPNSEFINNRVTNWTANDRQVRFSVPVKGSFVIRLSASVTAAPVCCDAPRDTAMDWIVASLLARTSTLPTGAASLPMAARASSTPCPPGRTACSASCATTRCSRSRSSPSWAPFSNAAASPKICSTASGSCSGRCAAACPMRSSWSAPSSARSPERSRPR